MYSQLEGIPIQEFPAGRNRVLVLFTAGEGVVKIAVRSAAGKGIQIPLVMFSTYEIELSQTRNRRELLRTPVDINLVRSRPRLGSGKPYRNWAYASFLSEVILVLSSGEGSDPYLYQLHTAALDQLETADVSPLFLNAYLLKVLEHAGYRPRIDRDQNHASLSASGTYRFSPASGGMIRTDDSSLSSWPEPVLVTEDWAWNPPLAHLAVSLRRARFAEVESLGGGQVDLPLTLELLRILIRFLEFQLETHLKSSVFVLGG